jgi:hypothetical protein
MPGDSGSLAGRAAEEGAAGGPAPCVKTGRRDASRLAASVREKKIEPVCCVIGGSGG